jgi:prepilin-type N-terminal cleavage/methylation domain-containing protein
MRKPTRRRAFTLVELTVVAALVAIFAAIAVPRLSSVLRNQRVNAAARRVAADLAFAAAKAKAASASRTVVFSVSGGSYTIPQEAPLDSASGVYTVALTADPLRAAITEANFDNTATATFDGYGRPTCAGYVKVRADGVVRTISIDADTGKAVIQ